MQVPAPLGARVATALSGWNPAPQVADCLPNIVLTAWTWQWAHLCDAELAAPDGTLTPHGRDLLAHLQHHSRQVRVEATNGQQAFSFVAHGEGARFVTLATEAPHHAAEPVSPREVADTAHTLTLGVLHRSTLPLVEARIATPSTPPPADSDANLREVWGQPWFAWTLTTTPTRRGMAMVHAGTRGQLTLNDTSTPGRVSLVAVPAQLVLSEVVRAVTERD